MNSRLIYIKISELNIFKMTNSKDDILNNMIFISASSLMFIVSVYAARGPYWVLKLEYHRCVRKNKSAPYPHDIVSELIDSAYSRFPSSSYLCHMAVGVLRDEVQEKRKHQ